MKVFKISVKFEQNGEWSNRKADTAGYLVKQDDEDDVLEGYVKVRYPTNSNKSVRYIKGLYTKEGALIFMQFCNDSFVAPICYCFSDVKKEGYWSSFDRRLGFFPVYPGMACSQGHATISVEEITDANLDKIKEETCAVFEENSREGTWDNECLMQDVKSLTDFLDEGSIFQMKLHCGKW